MSLRSSRSERVRPGIKVTTGIKSGGFCPGSNSNHNRRPLTTAQLLAKADALLAEGERVLERARREVGRR